MFPSVFIRRARQLGRRRALQAAGLSLLLAYVGGAVVFAPAPQRLNLLWFNRVGYWPSLVLASLVLLGAAWLGGSWTGAAIGRHPRRAALIGAVAGILALLLTTLLGSGWNFAQQALRFMPFPGTTPADFERHVRDCLVDYVGKPLAWVMPLGSVVAGLLGAWAGRRLRADLARLEEGRAVG